MVAGPPVEMPMAMARISLDAALAGRIGGPSAGRAGGRAAAAAGCLGLTAPDAAAARILLTKSSPTASRFAETVPSGLPTKSNAPRARHSNVSTEPCCVSELSMMTGQILSARIICKAVMPSSLGMLMSMVTTSGLNSFAFWTASSPSRAVAATTMPSSRLIRFRINAESSATSTRIVDFIRLDPNVGVRSWPSVSSRQAASLACQLLTTND